MACSASCVVFIRLWNPSVSVRQSSILGSQVRDSSPFCSLPVLSCFTDTAIVPTVMRVALAGIPLTPVSRIAGAVFYAALDTDTSSDGSPWLLPDDGPVFLLPQEKLTTGVYDLINARAQRAKGCVPLLRISFTSKTNHGCSKYPAERQVDRGLLPRYSAHHWAITPSGRSGGSCQRGLYPD